MTQQLAMASSGSTTAGDSLRSSESAVAPTSTSTSSSESECSSLLARLRSPTVSDLCRKRKIDANPPPSGKKRSSGQALTAGYVPKYISPTQRAREFPDEQLVESGGKLFCRACREILCVKRSVVSNHVKSSKHDEGKKKLKTKQAREADLALALENMILKLIERERLYRSLKKYTEPRLS